MLEDKGSASSIRCKWIQWLFCRVYVVFPFVCVSGLKNGFKFRLPPREKGELVAVASNVGVAIGEVTGILGMTGCVGDKERFLTDSAVGNKFYSCSTRVSLGF